MSRLLCAAMACGLVECASIPGRGVAFEPEKDLLIMRGFDLLLAHYDLLFAGHARSLTATLVTNSVKEFSRVEGLSVENWAKET